MSSKGGNPMADSEFLRSAVTQKEHIEDEYGVLVTTDISLRRSPYVLSVRLVARANRPKEYARQVGAYEGEWPNAYAVSWTAFLFQSYVRLERILLDSKRAAAEMERTEVG